MAQTWLYGGHLGECTRACFSCLLSQAFSCSSMVRAVKGMIAEKHGIFLSFILSLLSFQIITLAATWVSEATNMFNIKYKYHDFKVKMQTYAAVIASLVICTGGFYWYKHCLRIYNR